MIREFIRDEILGMKWLDRLIASLAEYRDALRAGDAAELKRLLKEGREKKEETDTEWRA